MVVRESLSIVLVGAVVGTALSVAGTRLLASMLFETSPTDLVTFGAVRLFLTLVAAIACWLPARRAARVDPMDALRSE